MFHLLELEVISNNPPLAGLCLALGFVDGSISFGNGLIESIVLEHIISI